MRLKLMLLCSLLVNCGETDAEDPSSPTSNGTETAAVTPDIPVDDSTISLPDGQENIVTITGTMNGEDLNISWDFKEPSPKRTCNGIDTVLTNGAMQVIASSDPVGSVSLTMESDWGTPEGCAMSEDDWLVRLTFASIQNGVEYANSKKEEGIQTEPFLMLTVAKGDFSRGHESKDATNTALTARLINLEYNKDANTLRLVGAASGTWSGGESINIQFNLLVNGEQDRNKNGNSLTTRKAGSSWP